MATQPTAARLAFFRNSLEAYVAQTYANRELLVLVDEAEEEQVAPFRNCVAETGAQNVRLELTGSVVLGKKRNELITRATGDLLAQWDDDDFYHPRRLEEQVEYLLAHEADAAYLVDVFQFFGSRRELYWTNFRNTPEGCHAATGVFRRGLEARYPESGETAVRGEDSAFLQQLRSRCRVALQAGAPHLYVYNSHGANTWSDAHHMLLVEKLGISKALLGRREADIRAGLARVDLGPGPVTVMGSNGAAFVIG